jgi:hypothetical protein
MKPEDARACLYAVWHSRKVSPRRWRQELFGIFHSEAAAAEARAELHKERSGCPSMISQVEYERLLWPSGFASESRMSGRFAGRTGIAVRLVCSNMTWLGAPHAPDSGFAFVLTHQYGGVGTSTLVGIYRSLETALADVEVARHLPGFRDSPDAFVCGVLKEGVAHWTDSPISMLDDEPLSPED